MGIKLDKSFDIPMYSPVCMLCKNYQPEKGRTCKAYTKADSIPLEIWTGKDNHKKPFPGDHGIQFELAGDSSNE